MCRSRDRCSCSGKMIRKIMGSTDFFLDRIRTSWYNAFRSRLERFSDALGVRGCDTDRKAQKSVDIYGLLAQLVEHIVHIDGVTGSSPVQTTAENPPLTGGFFAVLMSWPLTSVPRCEFIHIMGRGVERCQWQMKRNGSVVSKGEIPPFQGGITTIANLTEQAKRSETWFESSTDHIKSYDHPCGGHSFLLYHTPPL